MGQSLEKIWELNIFAGGIVHAGQAVFADVEVTEISVIETPVEDFVRPGELVLSTAIGCGHDERMLKEFVTDIMQSRAAGLAIATGRFVERIPQSIISVAQEYDFPLLELPWQTRFADIMRHVLNQLQNDLPNADDSLAKNLPIENQMAKECACQLAGDVILVDPHGVLIDQCLTYGALLDIDHKVVDTETEEFSYSRSSQSLLTIRMGNQEFGIYPVFSSRKLMGYLLASLKGHAPSDYLLTQIALWLLSYYEQRQQTQKRTSDLVNDLLLQHRPWPMLALEAQGLGHDLNHPFTCMTTSCVISHPERYADIEASLNASHVSALISITNTEIILFIDQVQPVSMLEIISRLSHLRDEKNQLLTWGIGDAYLGAEGFKKSFDEARLAQEMAIKQGLQYFFFQDLSPNKAIERLSNDPNMLNLVRSTLGSLMEYDHTRNTDLLYTLSTYIEQRTNVSKTSRQLNVHRQSLLYRLRKIEMLTHRSLEDPDTLFLFDLCLRLHSFTRDWHPSFQRSKQEPVASPPR